MGKWVVFGKPQSSPPGKTAGDREAEILSFFAPLMSARRADENPVRRLAWSAASRHTSPRVLVACSTHSKRPGIQPVIVLSVSQMTTLRWDLGQEIEYLNRSGWGGLGLYRNKVHDGVDPTALRSVAGRLCEQGLRPTSYSWIGGFTGSDPWSYDEAVQGGVRLIAEASEAGVPVVSVLAGGRNSHTRNHAKSNFLSALTRLAQVADRFDVDLAVQPVHPGCGPQWSFVQTLPDAIGIVKQVDHRRVGLAVDTYQIGFDDGWRRLLPRVVNLIKILQLGDGRGAPAGEMDRCALGDGCVPVYEILRSALDAGYEGAVEVIINGREHQNDHYESVLDRAYDYACGAARQVGVPVR